eukprot:scaffold102952_cov63-Phaeocystis_antarctica.AAC.1
MSFFTRNALHVFVSITPLECRRVGSCTLQCGVQRKPATQVAGSDGSQRALLAACTLKRPSSDPRAGGTSASAPAP